MNHQYPRGYANHIKRLDAPNPFHYLLLELQEAVYMIKINLSQALRADDLEDEDFYDDEEFRDESMNYPDGE